MMSGSKGASAPFGIHDIVFELAWKHYIMYPKMARSAFDPDIIRYLKKKGYPSTDIDEEELHMLLSAYLTACFEPIIHDCDKAKIDKYLSTIQEFFMPGWFKIMGLN